MAIYIIILITWILYFVSYFYSLRIRKRKEILITPTEDYYFIRDYPTIKKLGNIIVIGGFIYFVFICGLLGWELRWFYAMYIVNAIVILTLDRYLIAVNHTATNEKILGIKTNIISSIYRLLRGIYTYGFFILLPIIFLLTGSNVIVYQFNFCYYTIEMSIDEVRNSIITNNIKNKSYYNESLATRYEDFQGGFFAFNGPELIKNKKFFGGDIVITYTNPNPYGQLYTSKLFLFKKAQQLENSNPKYNTYNKTKDTLFFARGDYIVKEKCKYIFHNVYKNTIEKKTILK